MQGSYISRKKWRCKGLAAPESDMHGQTWMAQEWLQSTKSEAGLHTEQPGETHVNEDMDVHSPAASMHGQRDGSMMGHYL